MWIGLFVWLAEGAVWFVEQRAVRLWTILDFERGDFVVKEGGELDAFESGRAECVAWTVELGVDTESDLVGFGRRSVSWSKSIGGGSLERKSGCKLEKSDDSNGGYGGESIEVHDGRG